jgi:23S rRNA (pseudouridine1915-N3)-methyltransferase
MRIIIGATGKLKDGPERELYARYIDRLEAAGRRIALGPVKLVEIAESRAASAEARRDEEARRLLSSLDPGSHVVVLDESGETPASAAFSKLIRSRRDAGAASMAFLIGGADGHGSAVRAAAHDTIAFGAMTLPHGLVRVVLAEQLYRAATIITGHPYHRS